MKSDDLNKWLSLAANVGVVIGIVLLVAELNQNSELMRAQIFNERAAQGTDLFMNIADSAELTEIDRVLRESGFPGNAAGFRELTPTQAAQYWWILRADRFRTENLLYQQLLGILENDPGVLSVGRSLLRRYDAIADAVSGDGAPSFPYRVAAPRLRQLVADLEDKHRRDGTPELGELDTQVEQINIQEN